MPDLHICKPSFPPDIILHVIPSLHPRLKSHPRQFWSLMVSRHAEAFSPYTRMRIGASGLFPGANTVLWSISGYPRRGNDDVCFQVWGCVSHTAWATWWSHVRGMSFIDRTAMTGWMSVTQQWTLWLSFDFPHHQGEWVGPLSNNIQYNCRGASQHLLFSSAIRQGPPLYSYKCYFSLVWRFKCS